MSQIRSGNVMFEKQAVSGNWLVYWKGRFVGTIAAKKLEFNANSSLSSDSQAEVRDAAERMMLI